jgi:hypothetical protein
MAGGREGGMQHNVKVKANASLCLIKYKEGMWKDGDIDTCIRILGYR